MEAVGHLAGRGSPCARRFRIRLRAIPHEHLDPGMGLQPLSHRGRLPIGEQGVGPPSCAVHPDGDRLCRQPPCPPCPRRREAGESLGEDAAWAEGVAAEQLANAESPRDPVATPREIGSSPDVTTMDVPGWSITSRASGCCLYGRDQEGDLGLQFIDVAGVELERCGLGQHMGQRVSNLQRC